MKQHTLLVPLDGSAFSRQVIPHILQNFDPAAYQIRLLRVADLPVGVSGSPWPTSRIDPWTLPSFVTQRDIERAQHPIYDTQAEASARAELKHELQDEARELEAAGFTVQLVVRFGEPAEEIVEEVGKQVDMVAMVTHGHSGLRSFLMGSVAAEVLRQVSVPVMLVRPREMQ